MLASAKQSWLTGVQNVMVASIKHAKQMRPFGVWGYYDAVLPPDDCGASVAGLDNVASHGAVKDNPCVRGNDELPRLWEAVDAIMPSIYLARNNSVSNRDGIDSKVSEAMRLAANVAMRNPKRASPLVIPFACATYGNWDVDGTNYAWQH